ncbi:Protein RKD5 [Apostasia shenzhenica]|uniref:Protein RKD5 n=1 Tax=Apostasia shenzhenica TaxID=1088818 RepID=A0A2I0AJB0_9ASPA|nr:Protein RKD5 [Apostasia shenzhenica]
MDDFCCSPAPLPTSAGDEDDDVLRYLEFFDPDYTQPPLIPPPPSPPPPDPVSSAGHLSVDDPMQDPSFWDFSCHHPSPAAEPPAPGCSSHVSPETGAATECRSPPTDSVLLREVVHSNGLKVMRLRIHGGIGKFSHATLDINHNIDSFPPTIEQYCIDLSSQSFEWVKQFILDYGLLRLRDEYVMTEDSIAAFFDALCAGMSYGAGRLPSPPPETGGYHYFMHNTMKWLNGHSRSATVNGTGSCRVLKTGIAAQRERTGKLHIEDLANYFHLPIAEAARELRICSTALKKICRRHGMARWPHRKVYPSLSSKIDTDGRGVGGSHATRKAVAGNPHLREGRPRPSAGRMPRVRPHPASLARGVRPADIVAVSRSQGSTGERERGGERRIRSIDRRISVLLRDLCNEDTQEAKNAQAEIDRLRAQRARICAGLPT